MTPEEAAILEELLERQRKAIKLHKIQTDAWRKRNPEYDQQYKPVWKLQNKEHIRKYERDYYHKNKDKINKRRKELRQAKKNNRV
jgi:hypothetical protein